MIRSSDISVAIPAHPARAESGLLQRALGSVLHQTWHPAAVSLAMDTDGDGAPRTRQRALDGVNTPWVAFLDSDDAFYPHHLEHLAKYAAETGADYVFSYWDTSITPDILGHFGKVFNPENPTETTITILIRTGLAKEVGFLPIPERQHNTGEDFRLVTECVRLGAKIVHLPEQTWVWAHHGANTSGMPTKGDGPLASPLRLMTQ